MRNIIEVIFSLKLHKGEILFTFLRLHKGLVLHQDFRAVY
jgi:hypothetical protein